MKFSFLLCGFCVATASVAVAQRPTVAMDRAVLHERARIEARIHDGDLERSDGLRHANLQARAHRHFELAERDYQAAMDACTRWMAEYPYDASVLRAWRTDASTRLERVLLDDANLMLAAGRTLDALRLADTVLAMDPHDREALDARREAARLGNVPWDRAVAGRTRFVSGSP